MDLKKQHVEWDFHMDRLQFLGKYKVSGRVLILPITGAGDANITLCKYNNNNRNNFVSDRHQIIFWITVMR